MGIPFHTSRGPVDLTNLQAHDLTAEALGEALAKINRFGGRTPEPWSVAMHSILVAQLCPLELQPWALLHDAHKVFLGDLMDPSIEFLCQCGSRVAVESAVRNAENRIDARISAAWGTTCRSKSQSLLQADQIAFLAELWVFMNVAPGKLTENEIDLFDRAVSFIRHNPHSGHWTVARNLWLGRVQLLTSAGLLAPPRRPEPADAVSAGHP